MPRPLTKPWLVKVRLTDEEHARLVQLAAGRPQAVALAALLAAPPTDAPPATPRAGLEAWERTWLPTVRRTAPVFGQVRSALDALTRALG